MLANTYDSLESGLGLDTATYSGVRSAYTVTTVSGVRTNTDSIAGRDGTDTFSGVEALLFSDGTLTFDNLRTDISGRAYLLYRAAFDHIPDAAGLGYWIREMERGADYGAVVAASDLSLAGVHRALR